jgi:hypothetical protein
MLAGIESGVPVTTSFSLGLAESSKGSPKGQIDTSILRDSCPGNCDSGARVFWFGETGAIERLRAAGRMPTLGMPELARYLVQTEIDAGAPRVGGPVDVLRILPGGQVWVQKKPGCPVTMTAGVK